MAGGAPIVVSSWTPFGGVKPVTIISTTQFAGLRTTPVDGTFLSSGGGYLFRVAGGAPLYVSSRAAVGGSTAPAIIVDPAAIRKAGIGGDWNHLRKRPADGTFLAADSRVFRVAGGAPLIVTSWTPFGGVQPYTRVDPRVIAYAGQGTVWDHLLFRPATGTFLRALPSGRVFQVISGRPIYVPSWASVGGVHPTVSVNDATIDRAGRGGDWNHLIR